MAISVVLNEATLPKGLTIKQIQNAIAAGFAYPDVKVNVLSVPFSKLATPKSMLPFITSLSPLVHAILELFAALALLFGLALPVGRRLATLNFRTLLPSPTPPTPRPLPAIPPHRDFVELREHAVENIPGVAQLLQSWVDDND